MHIFLIRHGESMANAAIAGGDFDRTVDHLVPLSEHGREQAKEGGEWLKKYCDDKGIDLGAARIWRSPFKRTRETAELFNLSLGISDIKEDLTLTEQQYGVFDGLSVEDRERLYPKECEEYRRLLFNGGKLYARCPMGESPFDVAIRVGQFIDRIRRDGEREGEKPLFVFTHGCVLRALLLRLLDYSPEWYEAERNPKNCAIREIKGAVDLGYIHTPGE